MSLFSKFGPEARDVAKRARHIAQHYNHGYISTTHFLLAVLAQRDNLVVDFLDNHFGYDAEELYNTVGQMLTPETGEKVGDELIFTPQLKTVIDVAFEEMTNYGHEYIDATHLFLGLLKNKDVSEMFSQTDVNYKNFTKILDDYLDNLEEANDKMQDVLDSVAGAVHNAFNTVSTRKTTTKKKGKTPALDQFGTNLTEKARKGELEPVVGRDAETASVWQVLARKKKNNVLLVGDAGVGKSAIGDGVAQAIANGDVPSKLEDKEIISIDTGALISGTKYRGDLEKRVTEILKEAKAQGNVVLFIDEMHNIIGMGKGSEGGGDVSNLIKPALANGDLQVIGAMCDDDFNQHMEKDRAFARRFQKVKIDEPSDEDMMTILQHIRSGYEAFHNVKYSDEVIKTIIDLAGKYMPYKKNPDKSIDILDTVGAKLSLIEEAPSKAIIQAKTKVDALQMKQDEAVEKQDFELASKLKTKKEEAQSAYDDVKLKQAKKETKAVTEDDLRAVFKDILKVPIERITSSSKEAGRMMLLEDHLNSVVINQEDAIKQISREIKKQKAGLRREKSPISAAFFGATGVGKTFLAKEIAKYVYGSEKNLVYIDCSELKEEHSVNSKLLGASAGYVGHGERHKFDEIRENNGNCVILFDELEKANISALSSILLRVLEEGEIQDSKGMDVNFRHAIILFTSNVGSEIYTQQKSVGFQLGDAKEEDLDIRKKILAKVNERFRPEFLNRMGSKIVFNRLTRDDLKRIIDNEIEELVSTLKEDKSIKLTLRPAVYDYIVDEADKESQGNMGARPLRRKISDLLEMPMADIILSNDKIKSITVGMRKGELTWTTK